MGESGRCSGYVCTPKPIPSNLERPTQSPIRVKGTDSPLWNSYSEDYSQERAIVLSEIVNETCRGVTGLRSTAGRLCSSRRGGCGQVQPGSTFYVRIYVPFFREGGTNSMFFFPFSDAHSGHAQCPSS